MNEFEKLIQLHEDFVTTWAALKTAHNDAADMIAAVQTRLDNERTRNEERVAELQQTMSDPSRSETVRRVAAAELSRIPDCRYYANPAEVEAFKELIEQEKSAVRDLSKIKQDIRGAIAKAKEYIEAIRKDTLGHMTADLAPTWPGSQEEEFAKLCGEVKRP